MKIYSDVLDENDIRHAALTVSGVGLYECDGFEARKRWHGWNVKLESWTSNRLANSGKYGADHSHNAASYSDYGIFIAELFRRDPNALIAHYDGVEDFHTLTDNEFQTREV